VKVIPTKLELVQAEHFAKTFEQINWRSSAKFD